MALKHICWNLWIDEDYIFQVNTFLPPEGRRKLPLFRVFGEIPNWELYSESKVSFLNIFNDCKYSSLKDKFNLKCFLKSLEHLVISKQKRILAMSKECKSPFEGAPAGQRCDHFCIKKDNCIGMKCINCV